MSPTDGERFFEEQTETSRQKIAVYGKYLVPLANKILSKRYRRLWIVDAYAGAGTYQPGADGIRAEGSPVAAAKFARQYNVNHAKEGKEVRLVNVEADGETFRRLEESLMGVGPDVTSIRGRFQDHLDRILEMTGDDPAFFFIDPFGMEGADLGVIDRILARRSKTATELLINFSHAGFRRMAGNLDATGPQTASSKAAAATKVRRLNEIMDTSFWQGAWRNPKLTPDEKLDQVAALYEERLRARGIEHVHGIQMRERLDGPTVYRLIFATPSLHGVYLMSDFVCGYERQLLEAKNEGTLFSGHEDDERLERRAALKKEVHAFGAQREVATPLSVYMHFASQKFGEWRQTDFNICLRELVEEGGIERATPKGIGQNERMRFVAIPQADLFSADLGSDS
jgi:three-Cys-motif partner protein